MFATHPPLEKRIRAIEPGWNGDFEPAERRATDRRVSEARRQDATRRQEQKIGYEQILDSIGAMGLHDLIAEQQKKRNERAQPGAPEPAVAHSSDTLMQTIGTPSLAHSLYAHEALAAIPKTLHEASRDPYTARAVVYALLLDPREDHRKVQLKALQQSADPGVLRELERYTQSVRELPLPPAPAIAGNDAGSAGAPDDFSAADLLQESEGVDRSG